VLMANVFQMYNSEYQTAINNLATHLKNQGMRHVIFDLGNERNMSSRAVWVDPSWIQAIRNSVKAIDPNRIVMASNESSAGELGTVQFVQNTPLDVVAYHEPRPSNWYNLTQGVVQNLRSYASNLLPVYLQEPERSCAPPIDANHPFYSGSQLLAAVAGAKNGGAAAWTFHSESGFNLRSNSFWGQKRSEEADFFTGLAGALNGATWQACHNSLGNTAVTIGSGGGSGSVFVTTGGTCSWNVSANGVPWVGVSGNGPGSNWAFFTVSANPTGAQREASIIVAGRPFTIIQQPAVAQPPGYSALQDFNGDNRADIGDYHRASGQFWIRLNNGNGTFASPGSNWGSGTAGWSPDWQVLIGDFTCDGRADYADLHTASGNFWIHQNLGNGTFSGSNWASGTATVGSGWEVLAGDGTGDCYDDLIEHNRLTGELRIRVNGGYPGNPFSFVTASASFLTQVGADWRVLVADFTGDGWVDVADYHIPSAQLWIHHNMGAYQFSAGVWGYAAAYSHPVFTTIVGDFTGDNWVDYADVNRQTGEFWVHENLHNGSFAGTNVNWGQGLFSNSPGFAIFGVPVTIPPQ